MRDRFGLTILKKLSDANMSQLDPRTLFRLLSASGNIVLQSAESLRQMLKSVDLTTSFIRFCSLILFQSNFVPACEVVAGDRRHVRALPDIAETLMRLIKKVSGLSTLVQKELCSTLNQPAAKCCEIILAKDISVPLAKRRLTAQNGTVHSFVKQLFIDKMTKFSEDPPVITPPDLSHLRSLSSKLEEKSSNLTTRNPVP